MERKDCGCLCSGDQCVPCAEHTPDPEPDVDDFDFEAEEPNPDAEE